MYDIVLREDLINLNKACTINDLNFNRLEMKKIIKCRTQDKIDLLNLLLSNNAIDYNYYRELLQRAESDFKMSHLYLMGQCQI